jgi:hypothetical protein
MCCNETTTANTGTANDMDLRGCAGVGQGISKSMADSVRKQIENIPPTPFYQAEEAAAYPFEALDSKAIDGVMRPVVTTWLNVRAYSYVLQTKSLFLIILNSKRMRRILNVPPAASESQRIPP